MIIIWHVLCSLLILRVIRAVVIAHKERTCPCNGDNKYFSIWECPMFYAGIMGVIFFWAIGILWNMLWN